MEKKILIRAARVAGLTIKGKTDKEILSAFQQKYKLPETGESDALTEARLTSVASSRGQRLSFVKKGDVSCLSLSRRNLRLNKKSEEVGALQKNLAYLGYKISSAEHRETVFGRTTAKAVLQFQTDRGIPRTSVFDKGTRAAMNAEIHKINPGLVFASASFVIRGSIHNLNWEPVRMLVKVSSSKDGTLLCSRESSSDKGYFNLTFPAPDYAEKLKTGSGFSPFKVLVSLHPTDGSAEIFRREVECRTRMTWTNFTEEKTESGLTYDGICKGPCEYERLMAAVGKEIGRERFDSLISSFSDKLEETWSTGSGLTGGNIRMLLAANRASIDWPEYCGQFTGTVPGPDVIYALIRTGLADMSRLRFSKGMSATLFETLFFHPTLKLTKALAEAVKSNLMTRPHQLGSETWKGMASISSVVMLKKKCLEDNASLSDLLGCTDIPESSWMAIGQIFREYRSLSDSFFVKLRDSGLVSDSQYGRFVRVCEMGHVTLNKPACIVAALDKLGDGHISLVSKWEDSDWLGIGINKAFLSIIRSRAKNSYPDECFIVGLYRLSPSDKYVSLLYSDLMFRNDSDRLILSDFGSVNDRVYSENETEGMDIKRKIAGIRRIYLLTDNPRAASVLLADSIMSAVQIRHSYSRSEFVKYMSSHSIDPEVSKALYGNVEKQYMRIVSFYNGFRNSTSDTLESGGHADIRTLFGSQDAYRYDKTMSLLGQPAYYADLMRFLKKMPSEIRGKSAYDLLIGRRPDLLHFKLDTANSETLLPYIDLVCEILERELMKWMGVEVKYDAYNTTLPAETLSAMPVNVSMDVYRRIYESDYPVASAHFSLCQEEIRAYLNALGYPRYRIMQEHGVEEKAVAAEYFGLSALELESLEESGKKSGDVLKVWGLAANDASVPVRDFMRMTGLSYEEAVTVCRLFGFKLFGADLSDKGYPDVDSQFITLDIGAGEGLAIMRKFIMIWRHCGMGMEELHKFIEEESGGEIGARTLVCLYEKLESDCPVRLQVGEIVRTLMDSNGLDGGVSSDNVSDECPVPADLLEKLSSVGDFSGEAVLSSELLDILKCRYGDRWTEFMPEIYDPIRESKRNALVAFATESCRRKAFANVPEWKDSADIFDDLLVDVMMNAPMKTSRIKQATGSVQLFVQRCLLNLESGMHVSAADLNDTVSLDSWGQWKWMKNYRVWEANRKVFLFPENWIEPELRDDQTPFFKEFLDAADQMEPTSENFSEAVLEYLYKLDEVSHLEVCCSYRQIDKESNLDVLHVIARTSSSPTVHWYRSINLLTDVWTSWEKVEVDVQGDQMTLAMYRGRLHLFWLNFSEKALKPSALPSDNDSSVSSREAVKYYEIQLSWSVRKNGNWTSKSTSKKKLIHPWSRPRYSYDLKSYLDKSARLHLDVYLSTSEEFNNAVVSGGSANPEFRCRYSNIRHDETYHPWHSSTFLFEGYVTDVFMRDMGAPGCLSVDFINKYFGDDGRAVKKLEWSMRGPALLLPSGMHLKNNRLTGNTGTKVLYVGEDFSKEVYNSRELLSQTPDGFEMVLTQQTVQMDALQKGAMMFYQDGLRSYSLRTGGLFRYRFKNFYHPFAARFISAFNKNGAEGLFSNASQTLGSSFSFARQYKPVAYNVTSDYPEETVDFSMDGAYGTYNWELFFHIPLAVACRLSANGKYEDAMKWFHYIFNPVKYTEGQAPRCFWNTEPFRLNSLSGTEGTASGRIETILKKIGANSELLSAWKNNPFKPHIIARFRTDVYQKLVVREYIANLISWADDLFRQDTWETINEAVLLYQMAAEILGDRPETVTDDSRTGTAACSFGDISGKLDLFGNSSEKVNLAVEAMLAIEDMAELGGFMGTDLACADPRIPSMDLFYFNVPSNDMLVSYWDTVEDRMFKIRNSMNIDGIVRTLSLNAPEIDPAQLVKAAAAGISPDSFDAPAEISRPSYRFVSVLRKAVELTSEAKAMGDKLLSAIEKEDSAQLAELRAELEVKTLDAQTRIKELELESVREAIKNLEILKAKAEIVLDHYENIEHLSAKESKVLQMSMSQVESLRQVSVLHNEASISALLPSFVAGLQGVFSSPVSQSQLFSGGSIERSLNNAAGIITSRNGVIQQESSILSARASYERRSEDWKLQTDTAKKELESLESQIQGMNVRLNMADRDLENHKAQIENSKAVYGLICGQYGGRALYSWLKKETSALYRQMYALAYSYARKAEICYVFELGDNCPQSIPAINMSNWNADRSGLMSGDALMVQLRALEQSYLDNDRRCFELNKKVSLSELMDVTAGESALARLLRDGECEVDLPEWLYDMDYPTHGNRRIRNVTVTIPCVTGPNANVNCTITLLRELRRGRKDSSVTLSLDKAADIPETSRPSIATSSAVNDPGLFAVDFNGEKYLPFEGYGAVSRWKISLPSETNHFDRSSISDVIMDISFYAQDFGPHPKEKHTFVRLLSARHEFPDEWHRCEKCGDDLSLTIENSMIPSYMRGKANSLVLSAALKQTRRDDGKVLYENLAGGFCNDGKIVSLKDAGNMISGGVEDIIFVVSCNS